MKPQKQLLMHRPDIGQNGDCARACYACMFDMPVESVPHFADGIDPGDADAAGYVMEQRISDWLSIRGYARVSIPYNGDIELDVVLNIASNNAQGVYFILTGTSRTGVNHAVICKDKAIVWDPGIDDQGIVGPCSEGFWWVEFIISERFTDQSKVGDQILMGDGEAGTVVHVSPSYPKGCDHDWPDDSDGQTDMYGACTKCGMSFQRYIHTECP